MKIAGWTCIVGAGGVSRAASHPDNGNAVWIQGRFMGDSAAAARGMEHWRVLGIHALVSRQSLRR